MFGIPTEVITMLGSTMGGGLFHLAFGAILTGSAFGLNK